MAGERLGDGRKCSAREKRCLNAVSSFLSAECRTATVKRAQAGTFLRKKVKAKRLEWIINNHPYPIPGIKRELVSFMVFFAFSLERKGGKSSRHGNLLRPLRKTTEIWSEGRTLRFRNASAPPYFLCRFPCFRRHTLRAVSGHRTSPFQGDLINRCFFCESIMS